MALNTPTGQPSQNQATDFTGASVPNTIGYRFSDLDPGANIYVQRDDQLVIQCFSYSGTETLNVNVRLLQPGHPKGRTQPDPTTKDNPLGDSPYGVIVPINLMVPITSSFTLLSRVMQLAEGYLMSVAVSATQATVRGQVFVRVFVLRGSANVANVSYLLCADYVTTSTSVGWPFGEVRQPTDGLGLLRWETIGAPAAGADFIFNITNQLRGKLIAVQATLTTSAAVANRIVLGRLQFVGGGVDMGTFPPSQVIPASTVAKVTFAPGVQGNALTPTIVNVALPQEVWLTQVGPTSQQLSTTTLNIQAGDQWSLINGIFQDWVDI